MNVEIQEIGEVTVLRLDGPMNLRGGFIQLRRVVTELAERGRTLVVFDAGGVVRIDSTGMGELVTSYTRLVNAGGRVVLANISEGLGGILQLTQLITFFEIYDTADEAVQALSQTT